MGNGVKNKERHPGCLTLEDLEGRSQVQLVNHVIEEYKPTSLDMAGVEFLIAYESVGGYGFEGQWQPERTTLDYLKSDSFNFDCGGYDNSEKENREAVKHHIAKMTRKGLGVLVKVDKTPT